MELLRAVAALVAIGSFLCLVALTFVAYARRKDRTFWGGANILNGWWLIFPYGENGVGPEGRGLVVAGRLIALIMVVSALLAYGLAR